MELKNEFIISMDKERQNRTNGKKKKILYIKIKILEGINDKKNHNFMYKNKKN